MHTNDQSAYDFVSCPRDPNANCDNATDPARQELGITAGESWEEYSEWANNVEAWQGCDQECL